MSGPGAPAPIAEFDPTGEISVADRRRRTREIADEWARRSLTEDWGAAEPAGLPAEWFDADADAAAARTDPAAARTDPAAADFDPTLAAGVTGRPRRVPGRRTIEITGHGAERAVPRPDTQRRQSARSAEAARSGRTRRERPRARAGGFHGERAVLWALGLGLLLILVAVASAHAAV